jgi:hypothetical protein
MSQTNIGCTRATETQKSNEKNIKEGTLIHCSTINMPSGITKHDTNGRVVWILTVASRGPFAKVHFFLERAVVPHAAVAGGT